MHTLQSSSFSNLRISYPITSMLRCVSVTDSSIALCLIPELSTLFRKVQG